MSNRIQERFAAAKSAGQAVFVGYVTGGYPSADDTVPILLAMEAAGTGVIEIGVPFSDPLADGATVQHANQVAIQQGVTLRDCFAFVREARAQGLTVPVLLMGYYNPILAIGEGRCAVEAAEAGVDGFIVVDLPPEEGGSFVAACRANGLSFVPLVAPTTNEARMDRIASIADGFIYCVSMMGTTGGGNVPLEELPPFLDRIRKHTKLPLAVGFGVNKKEHVKAIGTIADAAVIGSAIIAAIDAADGRRPAQRVREFVEDVTGH